MGLGKLTGEYTKSLRDEVKSFCFPIPRQVFLLLMKNVEQELKHMAELGVIEPIDEPTDWCAPIVVVPKSNGDVRICVDLTMLNQSCQPQNLSNGEN